MKTRKLVVKNASELENAHKLIGGTVLTTTQQPHCLVCGLTGGTGTGGGYCEVPTDKLNP